MFDDARLDFDPNNLTDKQKEIWEAYNSEPDPELLDELKKTSDFTGDGVLGTYRIYVYFDFRRKGTEKSPALISVTKSNKKADLDMDLPLFFCSSEKHPELGCGRVLKGPELLATTQSGEQFKAIYCDNCKQYVNVEITCSNLFMNNTKKTIAERVYKLFRELNSDADIVVKYFKNDIKKTFNEVKWDGMNKVRENRERSIYTLGRMLKDVGDSGNLQKKIEDFLSV